MDHCRRRLVLHGAGASPHRGALSLRRGEGVRVQDGKTLVTDGPFVEMKEALGGYLFFDAPDIDAAIKLAARIPAARLGGAIEVRLIVKDQR